MHTQGTGYFTMVNVQSGFCLDDPWGMAPSRTLPQTLGTSTMLWQQPCNGNEAQNWESIPQSNSYFVIENQAETVFNPLAGTPMVIDDYYGEATSGFQMWLDTANGLGPQNWLAANTSVPPPGTIGWRHADARESGKPNALGQLLLMAVQAQSTEWSSSSYPANGWATQHVTLHSLGNGVSECAACRVASVSTIRGAMGPPRAHFLKSRGPVRCSGSNPAMVTQRKIGSSFRRSNGQSSVVENQAATEPSPIVIDDYYGEATSGLQMWLDTANGQSPQHRSSTFNKWVRILLVPSPQPRSWCGINKLR